jgi:histone deacetylase 1/2
MSHAIVDPSTEPHSFQVGMSIPHWREAMEHEYDALLCNKTWTLVPPPPRVNIMDYIECYKVHLVARGFRQHYGFDYEDTFNPVVKPTRTSSLAWFYSRLGSLLA